MMTNDKQKCSTLKTEIKASAARTREFRIEARKLTGMTRWYTQQAAKDSAQRERLLAYGYLRGRSYHQIEQKCQTTPSVRLIAANAGVDREVIDHWLTTEGAKREWPQAETLAQEVA